MINNVVLVGRLTKDLDLRYTSNGTAVATFTMAVNRAFTNQEGKRDADFINCVIWRKAAENMANFTHKGSLVGIEGTIQSRSYDNQQGQRVYVTEVVLGSFSVLEAKNKDYNQQSSNQTNNQSNSYSNNKYGDEPKSNQSTNIDASSNRDPFEQSGQPIDVSDDDLPF
ncbi:single-stranded DNA-binding protein [Carnobacterium sp. ISL-102]|uniref:single-stranded DNA-binding protein n=1 Tax=Carnobacterium sp. ISL-102 TaxID=2819142 RepID=UPI001BECD478|nr:single-stranded DNA-binding protein [Carnobacterium sp. ISL-102]MBT2732102.1 single-stranded DNA-binding protein [Carnobacterium sp. ISL-102]